MKLLIVEDDLLLQRGLQKALSQENYTVDIASTLQEATRFLSDEFTIYSAILLDLGLPDGNGITLLQALRKEKNTIPILIITARDALQDRIIGLDIRRQNGQVNNDILVDQFALNLSNKTIRFQDQLLDLTSREYVVLSRLLLKYPNVVPRELLMQDLYSWQDSLGSNTLEVYIHRLRQKVGKDKIQTVRGFGYQLVE